MYPILEIYWLATFLHIHDDVVRFRAILDISIARGKQVVDLFQVHYNGGDGEVIGVTKAEQKDSLDPIQPCCVGPSLRQSGTMDPLMYTSTMGVPPGYIRCSYASLWQTAYRPHRRCP